MYEQIKDFMDGEEYFEDEKYLFTLKDGIVYPMRKTDNLDETKNQLREYISSTWKCPERLHHLMTRQNRLQKKLLSD
jgi:hypothetical protein